MQPTIAKPCSVLVLNGPVEKMRKKEKSVGGKEKKVMGAEVGEKG